MPKDFSKLTYALGLINNNLSHKGKIHTVMDLKRTQQILFVNSPITDDATSLSAANNTAKKPSWWRDYSPFSFDYTRHMLGWNRSDKTAEYKFPQESTIEDILSKFKTPEIKAYIERTAHQDGFKDAARTEIIGRLAHDQFFFNGQTPDISVEFRQQPDNSVIVIENIYLPKHICDMHSPMDCDEGFAKLTATTDSIATISMISKISIAATEDEIKNASAKAKIKHEIIDFNIVAHDINVCSKLFARDNTAELLDFVDGTAQQQIRDIIATEKLDGHSVVVAQPKLIAARVTGITGITGVASVAGIQTSKPSAAEYWNLIGGHSSEVRSRSAVSIQSMWRKYKS